VRNVNKIRGRQCEKARRWAACGEGRKRCALAQGDGVLACRWRVFWEAKASGGAGYKGREWMDGLASRRRNEIVCVV
jgi:hypothetical protein